MSAAPTGLSRGKLVLNVSVAAAFGLFFAYDAWEALGNLLVLNGYAASLDIGIVWWGWIVLLASTLLPLGLLALAVWLGWRRPVGAQLALYVLGLAVSAAVYLSIVTLFNDTNLLAI